MRRLIALLATVALLLGVAAVAAAPASADYVDSRFRSGTSTICVDYSEIDNSRIRIALIDSVKLWRERTSKIKMTIRPDCTGFSQKVVAVDAKKGKNGVGAITSYGKFTWRKVPTGGSWTNQGYTWTHTYAKISFNASYAYLSSSSWHHMAAHEIGHTLGLDHVTHTCKSLMTNLKKGCTASYRGPGWWDLTGTSSHPGVNKIYAKG